MSAQQANCFSCKEVVEVTDALIVKTSNDRLRLVGQCAKCSKNVSRFVSDPSKPPLSAEEKKAREQKRRELKKKEKELHPELQSNAGKSKARKRRIVIGNIAVSVTAEEITEENQPKRRKLTLKEKREKQIQELKDQNSKLQEQLKAALEEGEEEEESAEESSDDEKSEQEEAPEHLPMPEIH